ncbi:MAG: hypothetical protein L3J37_07815 [Rhodobacteraceae bacterium]|nr:hypothetical protein [Paracoccaceae bacterium]
MENQIKDRPPPPSGVSLKAKIIFLSIMAVFVGGFGVYLKYPPLKQIGAANLPDGASIPVYMGALVWSEEMETYQKRIFVDWPKADSAEAMAGIALAVCNMARNTKGVFGNRNRAAPIGEITVSFVRGGRFLYRFRDAEDLQMDYDSNSCSLAPYLEPPLEDWRIATAQFSELSGGGNLRLGFRWRGAGPANRDGFPFKDVCEMVLQSPPRQIESFLVEDAATIEISLERALGLPLLNVYTWSGFRFQRVKNLCLEIGPVEEA